MCSMQSHMSEVKINKIPKVLEEDQDDNTHAIILSDVLDPNKPLKIPLLIKRVTRYFSSRKPRPSEH